MTRFEDQLFTDLMLEYGPPLQRIERPACLTPSNPVSPGVAGGRRGRGAGRGGRGGAGGDHAGAVRPRGPHQATVRLAAWTVTKQADGSIDVTVRQWRDPARLQATLRADGVPVRRHPAAEPVVPALPRQPGPAGHDRPLPDPRPQPRQPHCPGHPPVGHPGGAGLSISIAPAMQATTRHEAGSAGGPAGTGRPGPRQPAMHGRLSCQPMTR